MKNVVSAMFVACALSAAVGVAAQGEPATYPQQPATGAQQPGTGRQPVPDTQTPAAPTEQRSAASQSAAKDTVTISGCIQNAPAQGADASATGSKYVLANAKAGTGAKSSAVGTTGNAAAATRYRLDGEDKAISPHVNHQVEITGTVQSNSASATGATASAAGGAAGPMLKVDSVKMISATCQQP